MSNNAAGSDQQTSENKQETVYSDEPVFQEIGKDLDLLAWLQDKELDQGAIDSLKSVDPENWLALPPSGEQAAAAFELLRAMCQELQQGDSDALLTDLAADYAGLYVTHTYRASPSESVWMTDDSLTYQEPMFEIRKWYQRYHLSVPNWRERSDDHLVFQLEFLSRLIRMGSTQSLQDAGRFLDQHLMNWIEDFSHSACRNVQTPFYAGLVLLTSSYVLALRELLEELTGEERKPLQENKPAEAVVNFVDQPYVPGMQPGW